jgi:peroxiredoxin Q/BCP
MRKYGAYGEKMLYGKKTIGVIRSTVWIGPDGRIQKHWPKVSNAEEHSFDLVRLYLGQPAGLKGYRMEAPLG